MQHGGSETLIILLTLAREQDRRMFIVLTLHVLHEVRVQQLLCRRSIAFAIDTRQDEVADLRVAYSLEGPWILAVNDLAINLGRVLTLLVRHLSREHFENGHAKCINVDLRAVVLLVKFRRHKLWRAEDGRRVRRVHGRRKAEVTYLDIATVRVDEDVVALDVSVNDGRIVLVQVIEALQYFMQPLLDDLELRVANLLNVLAKGAAGDHFSDDVDLVVLAANPRTYKSDNVFVLQFFDYVDFGLDARTVRLVQHAEVDC